MDRGATDGATYRLRGETGTTFPPERTALLVIDPVNDFLSEGGAAWDLTRHTVRLHDVVGNLKRAIEGARSRGVPVLFGPMAYTEEDYVEHELHRRNGIHRIQFERKMFLAGSWGADFHPDLQPQPRDVVLLPHKGTDVFRTDLPEHLERLGTTHLVIAGMTANLCCESTGRRAAEEGYDVTFLADAIGSENLPSYEAAVRVNFPLIGNAVLTVNDFLAAIGPSVEGLAQADVGDTVRGSDNLKIGKVKEVVAATTTHEAYMLVPRGMILRTDTYIPLDAVTKRAGNVVFINVPRLVVGKMPWDRPQPRAGRQQMLGPPAQDVAKLYRTHMPTAHGDSANEHDPNAGTADS
ncbi:MAG: cysteine hydrolase [Gemmatimonadetes bacterium]|nr:cysteine hydrolase [Gemmatimonadota bacterium]